VPADGSGSISVTASCQRWLGSGTGGPARWRDHLGTGPSNLARNPAVCSRAGLPAELPGQGGTSSPRELPSANSFWGDKSLLTEHEN